MKPSHSSRVLRIGVTSRHGNAQWIEENTRHYLDTLSEFGVEAVVLSPDTPLALSGAPEFRPDSSGRLPTEVLDHLDGLILAGGGDVDPAYFGADLDGAKPETIDRMRDELELGLARVAMERNVPLFGICRGCQVLNVAAGGGMVQHFDGHKAPEGATAYHQIGLVEGTWFQRMIGQRCHDGEQLSPSRRGRSSSGVLVSTRRLGTARHLAD